MKPSLFRKHSFSCELDTQPSFKFHMGKDVRPTYRIILRTLGFPEQMAVVAGP
jgi:hypothetical protein